MQQQTQQMPNQNVVHETEAQRRHARIKIPAYLQVKTAAGSTSIRLLDISASGFSVNDEKNVFDNINNGKGAIQFVFGDVIIALQTRFQIVARNNGRVGFEFQDLGTHEVSALRHIITKFLAGEIVTSGDVLHIITRDNSAKARGNKGSSALTGFARIKALFGTGIMALVGLAAFAFVASKLYENFLTVKADVGIITAPSVSAVAPQEGFVKLAVNQGDTVKKGQLIATLNTPALSTFGSSIENLGLTADELRAMLSEDIGSEIKSPCDCYVSSIDFQQTYADKGTVLATLTESDVPAYIEARFGIDELKNVAINKVATFKMSDEGNAFKGKVSDVYFPQQFDNGNEDSSLFLAKIVPDEPVSIDLLNKPVTVEIRDF